MSLGSIVLCPPCLSLSHFSFVSTCALSRGGGGRVTRPHSHLRVGGGFIYQGRPLQVGGSILALSIFGIPSTGVHGIGWWQAPNDACWRTPCPGRTQLGTSSRRDQRGKVSRTSAGPAWACPMSVDTCRRGHSVIPNSGRLPRQTSGALIVTLLVTIQGSASCP